MRLDQRVDEEPEVVGSGRVQATGRRLCLDRASQRLGPAVAVVADCDPVLVLTTQEEARVVHAERAEHGVGHVLVKSDAGQVLDDLMEVGKSLTGVPPPRPRRPAQEQRPVFSPVGEAGGVAEDHTSGDRRSPLVAGQVRLGDVLAQRPVQLERACVDHSHDAGREDRLAQGSRCEHGVVVDRPPTTAATTGGHDRRYAIATDDPNCGAWDAVFIQQLSNHRPEIHGPIFHQAGRRRGASGPLPGGDR